MMISLDDLAALAFNAYWEGAYETNWENLAEFKKEQWRRVARALLGEVRNQ